MAPSRGLTTIRCHGLYHFVPPLQHHRTISSQRTSTEFCDLVSNISHKHQVHISKSIDPVFNLSVEHYLLQKTPPDSTILFLYVNQPCVIIGRNQNPWLEVDLSLLLGQARSVTAEHGQHHDGISLIRRRSGGGAVYHDRGNVNYSVICPTRDFHRDRSAGMVAAALNKLGVRSVRVNKRHDLVIDRDESQHGGSVIDIKNHRERNGDVSKREPLKVSGSAYKLTRGRALHHGTCLLSADLSRVRQLLQSRGKPYIQTKGVESVSSPVGNINRAVEAFQAAVVEEFISRYGLDRQSVRRVYEEQGLRAGPGWAGGQIDETNAASPEIQAGLEELQVGR